MRLAQLVFRNVSQHRLGASLTALNVALGSLLVAVILIVRAETEGAFFGPSRGYALVVGAPGSALELVLSTVFHVGPSPGLLEYEAFEELERHASTELAVPYAVGDTFRGFRVVGTSDAFFEPRFPYPRGDTRESKLAAGRAFRFDRAALDAALARVAGGARASTTPAREEAADEAVIGSRVAAALDVRVGDQIEPAHGVESAAAHEDPRLWRVVGVLRETKTPIDELVLINLDSFFRISEHRGGVVPESGKPAISAAVLFPKPGVHKALLLGELSKRTRLQVADVDAEVHQLLRLVGNVDRILLFVAVLVVIASVLSVAVAIYNSLTARRRELGILRVLGAGRRTIFLLIVAESTLLSALGAAVGLGLGHLAVWLSAGSIERIAGFRPRSAALLPEEIVAFMLIVAAGAVGGLIPALRAYRSDAASQLSPVA